MSCYEALAASYDGLTRDIPYEKYLRFFKTLLRRHGVTATTVLDLACGTGSLSVLLAKHGYRVLGVDRSEEMLTVAAEKAMELEENQPFFAAQPMQRLKIPEPVDACVCALDSINYVTKPQDVQKAFRRVYESLRPGGLFVFDINTPYKLESLDGQVFLDETEDSYCVWRAVYDRRHSLCRYGMDLFQRLEDDTWERSFEEHVERAYTPQELSGWLMDAGFADSIFGEVFDRLFNKENGVAVAAVEYPDVRDVLAQVHEAGGIAVLAHPYVYDSTDLMQQLVKEELLDGIEVHHPSHDEARRTALTDFAKEHHLLMTAGSDCHRPGDEGTTGILAETLPEDSFGYADLIRSGKYTIIRPE